MASPAVKRTPTGKAVDGFQASPSESPSKSRIGFGLGGTGRTSDGATPRKHIGSDAALARMENDSLGLAERYDVERREYGFAAKLTEEEKKRQREERKKMAQVYEKDQQMLHPEENQGWVVRDEHGNLAQRSSQAAPGIYQPLPELTMSVLQRPVSTPHQRLKDVHQPKLNHERLRSAFNAVAQEPTDGHGIATVVGLQNASFVLRAYGAGMLESEIESFVDEFGEKLGYTDFVTCLSRAQEFYLTKAWAEMAMTSGWHGFNPYDRFQQFMEAYDTLLDREGEDRININTMEAMLQHLGESYPIGAPNAPPSLFDVMLLIRDKHRRGKSSGDFEPWTILSGLAKYWEIHGSAPPDPGEYSQKAFEQKMERRFAAARGDEEESEEEEELDDVAAEKPKADVKKKKGEKQDKKEKRSSKEAPQDRSAEKESRKKEKENKEDDKERKENKGEEKEKKEKKKKEKKEDKVEEKDKKERREDKIDDKEKEEKKEKKEKEDGEEKEDDVKKADDKKVEEPAPSSSPDKAAETK